jgi:hypothetical protein
MYKILPHVQRELSFKYSYNTLADIQKRGNTVPAFSWQWPLEVTKQEDFMHESHQHGYKLIL